MSDSKPPKREFNPRSHAMIYLMAIVYLLYLIFQIVKGYLAGGPDAPSFALLAGGVAVLGGGCILLGVLARKMSALAPEPEDSAGDEENTGSAADADAREGAVNVDDKEDVGSAADVDGKEDVGGVADVDGKEDVGGAVNADDKEETGSAADVADRKEAGSADDEKS